MRKFCQSNWHFGVVDSHRNCRYITLNLKSVDTGWTLLCSTGLWLFQWNWTRLLWCSTRSIFSQVLLRIIWTLLITNILFLNSARTWTCLAQSKACCIRLGLYLEIIPSWKQKRKDDLFRNEIFIKRLHLQIYVTLFFELAPPFLLFKWKVKNIVTFHGKFE